MILASGFDVSIAVAFWLTRRCSPSAAVSYGPPFPGLLAFVLSVALMPPWDCQMMGSDTFYDAEAYLEEMQIEGYLRDLVEYLDVKVPVLDLIFLELSNRQLQRRFSWGSECANQIADSGARFDTLCS